MSNTSYSLLIVDDDIHITTMLKEALKKESYRIKTASNGQQALMRCHEECPDLVITDIRMPGMDGISLLKKVDEKNLNIPVILMTAFGSINNAVDAMKQGAYHYLEKPFMIEQLLSTIRAALREMASQREVPVIREEIKKEYVFSNIIGKSQVMQEVFSLIRRVAKTKSTVFIYGKSGTGKELVARAIHNNSLRKDKKFVAFNCAAISETLLETELFGHLKGAFTNAYYVKRGLFLEADGGTLFLDEIADMPLSLQSKLLRAIQEKEIRPVGAIKDIKVDVRLIAATNQDPQTLLSEGKIREDLYFRLNVVSLKLPDLKDRKEDIPLLVEHFLKKHAKENKRELLSVSREVMHILLEYSWPGNVRELENILERASVLTEGPIIQPENLPEDLGALTYPFEKREHSRSRSLSSLEELERKHIQDILLITHGNQSETARILGIDRRTLYRKIRSYNLQIP